MNKLPTEKLNTELAENPEFISKTITCLMDLQRMGKVETVEELEQRIDSYFNFCAETGLRPGIETMCLALGIDRRTFWTWCAGTRNKGERWREVCLQAKQSIVAFLESAMFSGKVSPPVGIFAMKNCAGWKDTLTIEDYLPQEDIKESFAESLPEFVFPDEEGEKNDDE